MQTISTFTPVFAIADPRPTLHLFLFIEHHEESQSTPCRMYTNKHSSIPILDATHDSQPGVGRTLFIS